MEIREGYKNTEVGVIPVDWEVRTIGDIFTFYSTSNFSKAEMALDGEVGCIHYGLIHAIDTTSYSLSKGIKYFINKEQAKYETIQEGDVVMVDASEDLVGLNKSVEVFDINKQEYIAGLHTFHLRDKESNYVNSFRGLILNSNAVKKQMLRLAVGMKVFGVSKPQLQQIFVPVPPIAEQTAIATALSDTDALINSLEKLIAKKQAIKQGAMQELLRPKEGWEVKRLGEIFDIAAGSDFKKHLASETQDEGHPFPIYSNSLQNYGAYGFSSYYTNEANCITVTARGTIGYSSFRNHRFTAIGRLLVLKPKQNLDCFYFSEYINNKIEFVIEVTGVPQLTAPQISKYEVSYPKNKSEQTRIARILSDMDAEIQALETKLEKYRNIKQGMMQELLTGKTRLI